MKRAKATKVALLASILCLASGIGPAIASVKVDSVTQTSSDVMFVTPSSVSFNLFPEAGLVTGKNDIVRIVAKGQITVAGGGNAVVRWTPGIGQEINIVDEFKPFFRAFKGKNTQKMLTMYLDRRKMEIMDPAEGWVRLQSREPDKSMMFDILIGGNSSSCCTITTIPADTFTISLDAAVWNR